MTASLFGQLASCQLANVLMIYKLIGKNKVEIKTQLSFEIESRELCHDDLFLRQVSCEREWRVAILLCAECLVDACVSFKRLTQMEINIPEIGIGESDNVANCHLPSTSANTYHANKRQLHQRNISFNLLQFQFTLQCHTLT